MRTAVELGKPPGPCGDLEHATDGFPLGQLGREGLARRPVVPSGGMVVALVEQYLQPPDLWWPDDRRWFVGGDADLDWCYVAGSAPCIAAVGAAFPTRARAVDWAASNAAAGTGS